MGSTNKPIDHEEIGTRDIFLTSDERFDVWNVKQEERPYLLQYDSTTIESSGANNDDNPSSMAQSLKYDDNGDNDEHDCDSDTNASLPLPLLDGCDLPGWRKEGLILSKSADKTSHYQQGFLNVGLGCNLLRKESQISACLSKQFLKDTPWKRLQARLLVDEPPSVPGIAKCGPSTAVVNGRVAPIRLSPNETEKLTGPHPWFEKQNVPVILEGCTANWKAMETCTWQNLLQEYGDYSWRFSDTHGACMSLETYSKYTKSIEGLTDDAPLAVYDSQLHLDERVQLLQDYEVPPCFDGMDLFQDVMVDDELDHDQDETDDKIENPETVPHPPQSKEEPTRENDPNDHDDAELAPSQNGDDNDNDSEDDSCSSISSLEGPNPPPYRWILMGPARSGTGLHIDPLGTHAWVTVVEGCKRWVLFPPETDQAAIGMQDPQIPSSIWFSQWYPRLQKDWDTTYKGAVEVLQRPGETVYVPAGWPHLVLNLADTVAITHNYASEYPQLTLLQKSVQEAEPELYQVWWPKLQKCRPDLFLVDDDASTKDCSTLEEKKED